MVAVKEPVQPNVDPSLAPRPEQSDVQDSGNSSSCSTCSGSQSLDLSYIPDDGIRELVRELYDSSELHINDCLSIVEAGFNLQTFNSYIEDGNQRAAEFEFDLFKAHQRGGFKDEPLQNQKFRALATQYLVDVFTQGGQDGRNDSSSNSGGGGGGGGSNNSNESLPFSGTEDSNEDVSSLEPLDTIYVTKEGLAAQFQGFKESITDHVQNHLRSTLDAMKTSITNNVKLMLQEQQAHADSQRALLPTSSVAPTLASSPAAAAAVTVNEEATKITARELVEQENAVFSNNLKLMLQEQAAVASRKLLNLIKASLFVCCVCNIVD